MTGLVPTNQDTPQPLMKEATLWDYFAANALAGVAANEASGCNTPRDLAHRAASVADSMMLQRERRAKDRSAAEQIGGKGA